jgi:hypothetical protein
MICLSRILTSIATVVCIGLTGCATQAPTLDFVPKDVLPSSTKIDFELKNTSVSIAQDGERTGPTQVGLFGNQYEASFKQAFKDALEEALAKSAVFNDLSQRKLTLSAKILQFETPGFSTGFETKMVVRYQLLDRSNGKLVFTRDITSTGSVPFDYAFLGAIRYTEARNRSGRDNVQQFIGSLAEFKDTGK